MATVVITFFLLTRFYVCKMDADYQESPRDRTTSRREKRWSMNSQRLEEIVAELMKPISDIRRSFDTDLSALLEEYLTEAGLHALEAGEEGEEGGASPVGAAPNYAELALLLQHSVCLYGRKVDFLYQHVLSVSDSLQNGTQEEAGREAGPAESAEAASGSAAARRRRRVSAGVAAGRFSRVSLEASAAARREPAAPRPPPTLPRMYIELEPRVLADGDAPLHDYAGEPIGLPSDFHVIWRLQDGYLVDELEGPRSSSESILNPISLVELQAAIEAAAPPSPPPLPCALRERSPSPDAEAPPLHASTPLPDRTPEPLKRQRKRRSDVKIDDIVGGRIKILISKELRRQLRSVQEFSIESRWISQVVEQRKSRILAERRRLRTHHPRPPPPPPPGTSPHTAFRGFDHSDADIGGFPGWSSSEVALVEGVTVTAVAGAGAGAGAGTTREPDSDDDGFFEQSSLGDSDHSRVEDLSVNTTTNSSWSRGLQVRAVARGVLAACPASGAAPFSAVLDATAKHQTDVSRILLATLFLANAGNVEILPGAPLSTGSFSVRLLSTDERLYCATARDHFQR